MRGNRRSRRFKGQLPLGFVVLKAGAEAEEEALGRELTRT